MKKPLFLLALHCIMLVILAFAWSKPVFAACPPDCLGTGGDAATTTLQGQAGANIGIIDQSFPQFMQSINTPGTSLDVFAPTFLNRTTNGANLFVYGTDAFQPATNSNPQVNAKPSGTIGFFASGIDVLVKNRPASSLEYVAYMGKKLHVPGTPEAAYAAGGGLGFNGLTPVLAVWTVSRNLAYFLFAIIFVIVGVMIMTRRKIDPKTAASIQNALPKIIFALIIVTFSYAIAGFVIDIMYVALGLIVTLMNSLQGNNVNIEDLLSGSIFGFIANGYLDTTLGVARIVAGIVNSLLNIQNAPIANNAVGFLSGGLAFLIVGIAILVALFRTWLALLGAFTNIILAVIFAPLRLTLDAIPGQNQFSGWIKDLIANALAFPFVALLLAIGAYISTYKVDNVNGFTPPLLGAGTVSEVLPFIGLGILLTIPKALDILREWLKAPAFKYGGAWMENMRGVQPVAQYGYKTGKWVSEREAVQDRLVPVQDRVDALRNTAGRELGKIFKRTS